MRPGGPAQPRRWERLGAAFESSLDLAAGALLFALMSLTCVDVVGRYLLRAPVRGGLELSELLMAVLIFAALPMVSAARRHVTVDLLPLPRGLVTVHERLVDLIGSICLSAAAWQLWVRAARAVQAGDVTAQLRLPVAPAIYLMCALTAVAALWLLLHALAGRGRGGASP